MGEGRPVDAREACDISSLRLVSYHDQGTRLVNGPIELEQPDIYTAMNYRQVQSWSEKGD